MKTLWKKLPKLILASASPRRQELLRELDVPFSVLPSAAIEAHHEHLTARELCLRNAYYKARGVAKLCPDALVLGADTLVCLGTRLFGKPADMAEARRMLLRLRGRTHQVVTGVCLLHLEEHRERLFAEITDVTFHPLSTVQIRDYLALVNPLDKAGAYAVQDHGEQIVAEVSGSYSNVVGLPVERLQTELTRWARSVRRA